MKYTGNNAYMNKLNNKRLILNLIRERGSTSRIELSKLTNLTKPTISTIISSFIEDGIVTETNLSQSQTGRKPMLLEINYAIYFLLSINISYNCIEIALSDLSTKIHYKEHFNILIPENELDAIDTLLDLINSFLHKNVPDYNYLVGIGISLNCDFDKVNIKNIFEDTLNIPTFVENSSYISGLCIKNNSDFDNFNNIGYLNISRDIILVNIINRDVIRSKANLNNIEINNHKCKDILSIDSLVTKYIDLKSIILTNKINNTNILELFKSNIEIGDISCINLLDEFIDTLNIFINNYLGIFPYDIIILDGGISYLQSVINHKLNNKLLVYSTIGDDINLIGASTLVANEFFKNYI